MAIDNAIDNVVTGIRHREGFEKGFEKGFTDGFSKGYKKHSKLVVKNLLKQGEMNPGAIAAAVGVSIDFVQKVVNENQKKSEAANKK